MSDCISLIDTRVDCGAMSQWVQVSQMTNVIHTESVEIISCASGYLEIEPFCVPDTDCRIVGALVYHSCDSGAIHSYDDDPISHVYQHGPDTCVVLDCWGLNPKQVAGDPVFEWSLNPCVRLSELRACQIEWLKSGKKTSWSFRDSSGSKTYLSERCLKDLIAEAEAACDGLNGINTRCITIGCNNGYR